MASRGGAPPSRLPYSPAALALLLMQGSLRGTNTIHIRAPLEQLSAIRGPKSANGRL